MGSPLLQQSLLAAATAYSGALLSRGKLHCIEEEFVGEPDAKWIKEDAQVRSWLWNHM